MDIEIIKSKRKTLAIEVKKDLHVIVRAPSFASNKEMQKFIAEKSAWIEKAIEKLRCGMNRKSKILYKNLLWKKSVSLQIRH